MSLIEQLHNKGAWATFMRYKQELGHLSRQDEADLKRFVEGEEYREVLARVTASGFPPPRKCLISKMRSGKKRVVYVFPRGENYVLKLLTWLLIRKYDSLFADNLYSFRARQGVRRAVAFLRGIRDLPGKYVYKADISDYFNSVDVSRLLPMLERAMADDPDTFRFISALLTDPRVTLPDGTVASEPKGIMAGVPLSSFLANVYLNELDWHFQERRFPYARYSDDIILFASTPGEREEAIGHIRRHLHEAGLKVNEAKERRTQPREKWDFLGISFEDGVFDVSEVSARKLKMKMRRKSRALLRWKDRKEIDNRCAARAFVKIFNKKLYDNDVSSELTWARWFFPLINTTRTLAAIDHYAQDCLRYIATEKRNGGRFRFRYGEMKSLGYRSLVHEYYSTHDRYRGRNL